MKTYNFKFKARGEEVHISRDTEEDAFLAFLNTYVHTRCMPLLSYDSGVPHFRHTENIQLPDFYYWETGGTNNPDPVGYTGHTLRSWLEKRLMKFTEDKT